jgi:hypothetical protein
MGPRRPPPARSVSALTNSAPGTVPYVGQWESPELIHAFLRGDLAARHDPRWVHSGAASAEQYEFWSWRCCGMACLRSVLMARNGTSPGIVSLALETLEAGGYRLRYRPDGDGSDREDNEPEGVDGLIYAPFVAYLARRWEIAATVEADLSTPSLVAHVRQGAWVMASVHPAIRHPEVTPPSRGGHLVLVHATARRPDGQADDVVLHNPSGDTPANQADVRLSLTDFGPFFAGRGVVFAPVS